MDRKKPNGIGPPPPPPEVKYGAIRKKETNLNTITNGKIPPQAIDLEEVIIGSILIDKRGILEVADILLPEMFYKQEHSLIFVAVMTLFNNGEPIDLLTVSNELKRTGKIDIVGGEYNLIMLTQKVSSAANIEFHSRIIIQKYVQRRLIALANNTIMSSYQNDSDIFDVIENIEVDMLDIHSTSIKSNGESNDDVISNAEKRFERAQAGLTVGLPILIQSIDDFTSGLQPAEFSILAARPSMGKGVALNELISTPLGMIMIKDLKVGDEISNTYGETSTVVGYYPQGKRPIYEITFDDGLKVKADDQHLWEVQDRAIRKRGSKDVRVLSTLELLTEGLYVNNTRRKNFSIKYTEPVNHTKKKQLIDPYILGCLIGDGHLSSKNIGFANTEKDILKKFELYFKDKFINKGINSRINKCDLHKYLEYYNLINKLSFDKFIPDNYLYSSIEDRIKLLQGLLDTDGHVVTGNENHIEYSTTSLKLKDNIMTLVRGLGGRCSFTKRMGRYKKDGKYIETRINYRIWITFPKTLIPVSSDKHLKKYINKKKFHKRFITNIKYLKDEETICIKVDSNDECFLMNDYLVTHNTTFALILAMNLALVGGYRGVFFSLEMPKRQLYNKIIANMTGIPYFNVKTMKLTHKQFAQVIKLYKWFEEESPLTIVDNVGTIPGINKYVKNKKPTWIIIDYLQIMTGDNSIAKKSTNREQEVGYFSRSLKQIAKKYDIPVLALSQLSRKVDATSHHMPRLSDLRESGSLEQDADNVIFIVRQAYYDAEMGRVVPEIEKGNAIIDWAKGRDTGTKKFQINIDMVKLIVNDHYLYNGMATDVFDEVSDLPPPPSE